MSDANLCMHSHARLGVFGGILPCKILEIRWYETAEAILGQKQSHSNYMARKVLHPIFACPRTYMYAFVKPADIKFQREKVLMLAELQLG